MGQLDYGVVDTGWATESHRIKGANRRISERRCRWHRLFSCIGFGKPRNPHPEKVKFCSSHHTVVAAAPGANHRLARRDAAWSGSTSGRAAMAAAAAMPASGRSIGKATGRPRSGGRSQGEACRRGCCRCSQGERAELAAQVLQVAAAKQRAAANQQVADKQRAAAFCEVDGQQWFCPW